MNDVNEFHPGFEIVKREIEYFLDGSVYDSPLFKTFCESETSSMDLLRNYRMFLMEYFRTFKQLYYIYPRCILGPLIEKMSKLDLIFDEFSYEPKNPQRYSIEEIRDYAKELLNSSDEIAKEYAKKMLNPKDDKEYEESVKNVTNEMWRNGRDMAIYYIKWHDVVNWESFKEHSEEEYSDTVDSLLLEILEKPENMETICESVPKELLFPLIVIMIHGTLVTMRRCSIKEAFLNSFDETLSSINHVVDHWSYINFEDEDDSFKEYIRLADLDPKYDTRNFKSLNRLLSYGERYSRCYEWKEDPDKWIELLFK